MCNINIIYNKKRIANRRLAEYMNVASFNSWGSNHDGEGFISMNKDKLKAGKSLNKIVYNGIYSFLATHQRYTTSGGNTTENTHPHKRDNLMVIHNGVFSNIGSENKSDTAVFSHLLEKEYMRTKKDLIQAIKNVTKEVGGSYSVLVYEKKTGKTYYFKESSTSMYILKTKDLVIMSTKKENLEYAQFYFNTKNKIDVVIHNIIYDLTKGFQEVDVFEPKRVEYYKSSKYDNSFNGYTWCVWCGQITDNNEKYCDDCKHARRKSNPINYWDEDIRKTWRRT